MPDSDLQTPIHACFERLSAGDLSARTELIQLTFNRLLFTLRNMLARYPRVRRWAESDDVLQNVMIRLDRCFADDAIKTPTDYFRLAATNMRRELEDLVRHYFGPEGIGKNHKTPNQNGQESDHNELPDSSSENPAQLALASELHEAVDALPIDLREVVELHWYLGMTKTEAASLLGVSLSTVKRRCVEAKLLLVERLGDGLDLDSL